MCSVRISCYIPRQTLFCLDEYVAILIIQNDQADYAWTWTQKTKGCSTNQTKYGDQLRKGEQRLILPVKITRICVRDLL